MAEKILEILESGHLRKLDHISESVPVLELFSNIWGAGTKTAHMWYHQVTPHPCPCSVLLRPRTPDLQFSYPVL